MEDKAVAAMDVEELPVHMVASNDERLQLPWVEKYRPKRYE
jgi:hypothetical protein